MRSLFALVLLFATLALASDVKDLNGDNFDSVVDGSVAAFVEFYAPWCGHCKRLAPEYELVATAFKKHSGKIVVAKVDCDTHKDLCAQHGISGYPTLKFFPAGDVSNPVSYSEGRTAPDIINYISKQVGVKAAVPKEAPSSVVVLTSANFDKVVLDSSKDVFVEFYAPWCGHCKSLAPTYEKFAKAFENEDSIVIAKIDCDAEKELCPKYGVTGFPTLQWFPKDNKQGTPYSQGRDINDLVEFINDNAGTDRNADGTLGSSTGIIEDLASAVENFKAASDKAAASAKGVDAAFASAEPTAKIYAAIFQKAVDSAYVSNEIARIERILSSNSLSSRKIDEFTVRLNILKIFA